MRFRRHFGLPADAAALAAAAAAPHAEGLQRYGVALTATEFADQRARDERADAAGPLAALVSTRADELAGMWIDHERGGEFVVMAAPATTPATRALVTAAVPAGGSIRFEPVQHSGAALDAGARLLTAAMIASTDPGGAPPHNPSAALKDTGFVVLVSGVDARANRISVGFQDEPGHRRQDLHEAWDSSSNSGSLPPRGLVNFVHAPVGPVDSRYDSPGTMKGGLEVFGLRPGSASVGSYCTSNVAATGGIQMTASHCYAPNTRVEHAGMAIGSVVYDGHVNGSNADVAGIQLNAGGLVSADLFSAFACNGAETCQQIDTAGAVRNPVLQNDRVCGSGRSTYWVMCGPVTLPSATWSTTDANDWRGGVTFQDQAVAAIGLGGGDSGGVIGNGPTIFGITGGSDGRTTVFSKMHNALARMGRGLVTTRGWGLLQSLHSGKCADVAGNNPANGTRVWSWPCNGNPAQQWTFSPVGKMNGGDVLWYEVRRASPANKCLDLDIAQGGSGDGAKIQEWDCNGWSNQRWRLVRGGTSSNRGLQVISQRSGKCVDLDISGPGAGYQDGARLQQWSCLGSGQRNQIWQVA